MKEEQILVVPRTALEPFIHFRGFRTTEAPPLNGWLNASVFKSRSLMETNPAFKQLIPYILLRFEDQVYRYWRTKRAGEDRLHHLYSLGIGGHINQRDENLFTPQHELLEEAAMRELREEVDLPEYPHLQHIGFINDDDTDVGQVHLGIVYEAWLFSKEITIRESALGRGEWKSIRELQDVEYETWSQFLVREYLAK